MDSLHDQYSGTTIPASMLGQDGVGDLRPSSIATDERRMQVRAYNLWVSLLDEHPVPNINQLTPYLPSGFGANSVLLDFSQSPDDPVIVHLGAKFAGESGPLHVLSDAPVPSILATIAPHYAQAIARKAPLGFESEFINPQGAQVLSRGIILPFSHDSEAIDFAYVVINWKENTNVNKGPQHSTHKDVPIMRRDREPMKIWADGPANLEMIAPFEAPSFSYIPVEMPAPGFAHLNKHQGREDAQPKNQTLDEAIATAQASALRIKNLEKHSQQALYELLGQTYDLYLMVMADPTGWARSVPDADMHVQENAAGTALLKLIFGADISNAQLSDYTAIMAYGRRSAVQKGHLPDHLQQTSEGLKFFL